jgi:hypothetical protein
MAPPISWGAIRGQSTPEAGRQGARNPGIARYARAIGGFAACASGSLRSGLAKTAPPAPKAAKAKESRSETILALVKARAGATRKEICEATGMQSVSTAIARAVEGAGVKLVKVKEDRETRYFAESNGATRGRA